MSGEEEVVDPADLAELQAFLAGAGGGGAPALEVTEAPPARPPGFEDGPGAAAAGPFGARAASTGQQRPADPLAAKDPWSKTANDPWSKASNDSWAKADSAPHPAAPSKSAPDEEPWPDFANVAGGLTGETSAKVVVEQEDSMAPYLAATSWDELNLPKEILDGIFEMGFVKPSKIQEWTLPIALNGGNIIGQAQNGSGKTAAFALAMLLAMDVQLKAPQGLCVCPTRELACQNHDVVAKLGKFTGVKLWLAVPQPERPPRKVDAQVVVGTPGKLQDLMKKRVIEPRGFKVFVVDEADEMIDEQNSMGPQVTMIRQLMPQDLQVLLFSATWPDHVERFAKSMVPRANHIKVQKEDLTLSTITQTFIHTGGDERQKLRQLSDLYGALNVGQSIVFVNTRMKAFELAKQMKAEGHAVSLICGTQASGPERVDHAYRDRIMGEFRSGVTKVLISTDVLSRGIDVPAVTLVVNYELPQRSRRGEPCMETYMHRIGRTGRFGLKGLAVNFVSTHEQWALDRIREFYKCTISKLDGDCEEMSDIVRKLR